MRDAACAGRARTVSAHAAAIATRASLDVLVIPFSPMRSDCPFLMRAPCHLGESATGLILKEKMKSRNRRPPAGGARLARRRQILPGVYRALTIEGRGSGTLPSKG